MAAEEQIPPPLAAASEQEREQQDVSRLRHLPPLEYDRMNEDQRAAFIQWYQQMTDCGEMFEKYPKGSLESIFAAYPTEEPADTQLKESILKNFKLYLQQTWSYQGRRPRQPDSYFLLHKKFSRLIAQGIYLPTHMDMVPTLLFSLQEVDHIKTQGLESIITAVGSNELHFHELGTLYPNDKETLYIYLRQNSSYFLSANTEFMKQETAEVWFRRANEGIPQFIFCPAASAVLPQLPLPLSTPGKPEVVLELARLDAVPPWHFERCGAAHKSCFYQWLSAKVKDGDSESLKLAAYISKLVSNDWNVAKPKIPKDKVAHLYEKYVQKWWNMPSKQLPEPGSIYLFEKKFETADRFCILLPQELMEQVVSLVLSTEEFNQLFRSKVLFVMVSITTSKQIKLKKQGALEFIETDCKITFFDGQYNDISSQLISEVNFEVWFLRTLNKPKFIIQPRQKRS